MEYDYGIPDEGTCPDCDHEQRVPSGAEWGATIKCEECGESYEVELPDCCEPCGWSYDRNGYLLKDCLDNDIFVMDSPYYTYAQFCSPCVPGAGNLDSPFKGLQVPQGTHRSFAEDFKHSAEELEFPKVLCLSHDWFEGGKAPYEVFEIKTGERVLPAS